MDFGGKNRGWHAEMFLRNSSRRKGRETSQTTSPILTQVLHLLEILINISLNSPLWDKTNYVHIDGGGLNQATLPDNLSLSLHHYSLPLNNGPCGKDNYWFYQVFLELSSTSCLFCLLNKPPAVFRTEKSQQTVFSSRFTPTNPDPCETTPKIPSCHATEGRFYASDTKPY